MMFICKLTSEKEWLSKFIEDADQEKDEINNAARGR